MRWNEWKWRVVGPLGAVFLIWLGYELHPTNPLKAPERIVPAAVLLPPDRRLLLNGRERERLELALRSLLRHVDSLAADSAGRRVFDSLVRARPGLLDSARKAERYFSMEELLNH